ncbi:MAG: RES family NAD+ phosphorylase [Luteolibacter sp.]|uniref:RES family NAD+ phosphorylase n=1 Tax=Luteolibacter sp. TaxID=1962973 RepID=UPI003264354A
MTIRAWRIVKEKHAATAFSGEGAAVTGGRWNSRGNRVVYTSGAVSLAALESLVHLNPLVRFKYVVFKIEFAESLVEKIMASSLHADWMDQPPPPSTKQLGDRWLKRASAAVLELPSVIVPIESNFLLNTSHPDFKMIRIGKPEPFSFDPRLLP